MERKFKYSEEKAQNYFNNTQTAETETGGNAVLSEKEKTEKIKKNGTGVHFCDDVKIFFEMVKNSVTRKYPQTPFRTIFALIGAFLYLFLPADLIPDFLPFIGYLDDATVFGLCLKLIKTDINAYRKWKDTGAIEGFSK